jgi:hypothetical protein
MTEINTHNWSIFKDMIFSKFASLLHSKNIHSINLHQTQVTISVASLNSISRIAGTQAKLNQLATMQTQLNQGIPKMKIVLNHTNINIRVLLVLKTNTSCILQFMISDQTNSMRVAHHTTKFAFTKPLQFTC